MYSDPGWGAAAKYGFLAIFARSRTMKLRPAITAARAGVLGFVYSSVFIAGVLTSLGDVEDPDYLFAGLLVGAGSVTSGLSVLFFRFKPPTQLREGVTAVEYFVTIAALISALGAVSMLMGFVTFFLGGGYPMYAVGMFVSLVLLLGPGRPGEGMVRRVGERVGVDPDQLWRDVLEPSPVER